MIRIFFIILIAFLPGTPSFAANENNRILTLEQINADLEAKKRALEPFDQNDVKIDLESLGLDDVSKKSEALIPTDTALEKAVIVKEPIIKKLPKVKNSEVSKVKKELKKKEEKKPEIKKLEEKKNEIKNKPLPIPAIVPAINIKKKKAEIKIKELPIIDPKSLSKKLPEKELKETVKKDKVKEEEIELPVEEDSSIGIMSRIRNILDSDPEEKEGEKLDAEKKEITSEKPTKEVDKEGKKTVKKVKKLNKKQKWSQKKEKLRLKELNDLRKKYLNSSSKYISNSESVNYLDSSEYIVPYRKDLNQFLVESPPALPIINSYRTRDNVHIPLVVTEKDRTDLLFSTIAIGDISAFNEAYNYIKNPDIRNNLGDTILTYAILMKKYPIIISILAKGSDPDIANRLGYTPVNLALELGDFKALEILVNNKANLEYIDAFGRNYLMHAARIGTLSAVKLLIDRGIDVNIMDNDGFTALAIAYKHNQNIVATYLLKHGAKTWVKKPYNPQDRSIIKELENSWK